MEQQIPIPLKSRMKPREGQKTRHFPIFDLGGRGGGGQGFPFILSKIVGKTEPRSNKKTIGEEAGVGGVVEVGEKNHVHSTRWGFQLLNCIYFLRFRVNIHMASSKKTLTINDIYG